MADRAILMDDATRAGLRNAIDVEALGPLTVRGRAQSVDVFSVIGYAR